MYSVKKNTIDFARDFDYILFSLVLLVASFGLVVLHSATRVMPPNVNGNGLFVKQVIALLMGIALCLIISAVDYQSIKNLGWVFYIGCVILLVGVLFWGTGKTQVGTNGWFNFKGVSFQPAEISKLAFVIYISKFFEKIKENDSRHKNIVKLILYAAIPVILVLAQPDAGSAMVFMFMFAVMVYICEIPYKYIFLAMGSFLASLPVLWLFLLQPHQKDRIMSFLSPEKYSKTISFQVTQSTMTIGAGQLTGNGLYNGIQTQNLGVPEKHTDFIFSVIGEEFGFIGCGVIIVLFLVILLRCLYIAKKSKDAYGSFLVIGIASMFFFHIAENIGMNIRLLPVTGIPLPFISYGGSSMITNFIAIGVILSVSARNKRKGLFA